MKRIIILFAACFLLTLSSAVIAQPVTSTIDSTEAEADAMPPTSKTKKSEAATKYSTPPKSKSDWKKKIYVGGYFGLGFGTYTNIELSPIVGYNFTENFNMGIGVIYNYYSYNIPNYIGGGDTKISSSNWGGRINANYTLFNILSLGAEYQYLSIDWFKGYTDLGAPIYEKEPVNVLLLGGGIRQKAGRNVAIYVMAFYDVIQDEYSPYGDNIVWRVGVAAGF